MSTTEINNPENPYIAIDKKWARRKRVFKILIVVLIICSPFLYRASRLWKLPDIGEPFDVQKFVSYSPTDEENAFTYYRRAGGEITLAPRIPLSNPTPADKGVTDAVWSTFEEIENSSEPAVPHQQEWEKWINENKEALLDWQAGTTRIESLHIPPAEMEIGTQLETTHKLHQMRQLVIVKAKLLADAGKLDEAWDWYRALFRCSRHLGHHHSGVVDRIVGSLLYNTACKGVLYHWANNDQVTDKQLSLAISELIEINAMTTPIVEQLKAEYVMCINTLAAGDWAKKLIRPGVGSAGEDNDFFNSIAYWLANEPNVSRRLLNIHISQFLDGLDQSYNQNSATSYQPDYLSVREIEPLAKASILGQEFPGMFDNLHRAHTADKAHQAVLIAMLSAYRFKLANGYFPQSIDELKSAYTEISFVDPNGRTENKMLGYRINKKHLLIWSVGPNGTNENGNITRRFNEGADVGFEIELKTASKPVENSDNTGVDSPSPK